MKSKSKLVQRLHDGFNARDIDAVLAALAPDVTWANGMDGGHVHGHDSVRAYWTREWAGIDPRVEPGRIEHREDGSIATDVHQVVRDLDGNLLLDEMVRHVFHIEAGRVTRFDIENAGGLSVIAHQASVSDSRPA